MSGKTVLVSTWVGSFAVLAMVVGASGPWALRRYSHIGGTPDASVRGTDITNDLQIAIGNWEVTDGWLVISSAVLGAAGLCFWLRQRHRGWLLAAAAAGLAGLAVTLYDLRRIGIVNSPDDTPPKVDAYWGLWLAVFASSALTVTALVIARATGAHERWFTARRIGVLLTLLVVTLWGIELARGPQDVGPTAATLVPIIWTSWAINTICSIWITIAVYHRSTGPTRRRAIRTVAAATLLAALSLFGCFLFTPFAVVAALLVAWRSRRTDSAEN